MNTSHSVFSGANLIEKGGPFSSINTTLSIWKGIPHDTQDLRGACSKASFISLEITVLDKLESVLFPLIGTGLKFNEHGPSFTLGIL